jgi:hypothetical protein
VPDGKALTPIREGFSVGLDGQTGKYVRATLPFAVATISERLSYAVYPHPG